MKTEALNKIPRGQKALEEGVQSTLFPQMTAAELLWGQGWNAEEQSQSWRQLPRHRTALGGMQLQETALLSKALLPQSNTTTSGATWRHCLPAQHAAAVRCRCLGHVNARALQVLVVLSPANTPRTLKSPGNSLNEPLLPQTLLESLGEGLHVLRNTELQLLFRENSWQQQALREAAHRRGHIASRPPARLQHGLAEPRVTVVHVTDLPAPQQSGFWRVGCKVRRR